MTLDTDQYDEIAQYAAGGIAIVALAGLMYTETVPAAEGITIILGVLSALGAYESGKRGQKKKTNAPDVGDLVDTLLTAMDVSGGSESTTSQDSQTGTPADHTAAEGESMPQIEVSESELRDARKDIEDAVGDVSASVDDTADDSATDLRTITGIGPTCADLLTGQRVESVADLATANTASLAASTGITQSRLDKWQEQANELTSDETSGNDPRGLGGP